MNWSGKTLGERKKPTNSDLIFDGSLVAHGLSSKHNGYWSPPADGLELQERLDEQCKMKSALDFCGDWFSKCAEQGGLEFIFFWFKTCRKTWGNCIWKPTRFVLFLKCDGWWTEAQPSASYRHGQTPILNHDTIKYLSFSPLVYYQEKCFKNH